MPGTCSAHIITFYFTVQYNAEDIGEIHYYVDNTTTSPVIRRAVILCCTTYSRNRSKVVVASFIWNLYSCGIFTPSTSYVFTSKLLQVSDYAISWDCTVTASFSLKYKVHHVDCDMYSKWLRWQGKDIVKICMRNANFFHLSVYMQTETEEELEVQKKRAVWGNFLLVPFVNTSLSDEVWKCVVRQ